MVHPTLHNVICIDWRKTIHDDAITALSVVALHLNHEDIEDLLRRLLRGKESWKKWVHPNGTETSYTLQCPEHGESCEIYFTVYFSPKTRKSSSSDFQSARQRT